MNSTRALAKAILPRLLIDRLRKYLCKRNRSNRRRNLLSALKRDIRYGDLLYEPVAAGTHFYEPMREWEERWRSIREIIQSYEATSLLDLGCAEGWFVRRAAQECGCFAIGVETDISRLWRGEASRLYDEVERCSIMKALLTPSEIVQLPKVDVVLCLSVVHHVIRRTGLEDGKAFVAAIGTRASKAIVFEMGTREEAAMEWVDRMPDMPEGQSKFLQNFLEAAGLKNVREIGITASLKREATRVLMVAEPPENLTSKSDVSISDGAVPTMGARDLAAGGSQEG